MGLKARKKRMGVGNIEQPLTVADRLKALEKEIGETNAAGRHVKMGYICAELREMVRMFELRHTNDTGIDHELKILSEYIAKGDNINAIGRCNSLIGMLLQRLVTRGR